MTAASAIRAWLASVETPTELPRWSPTWASDVAADAERFREEGLEAEEAWWRAAALHRPEGVPEPGRYDRPAETVHEASARVRAYLVERGEPLTAAEVAKGLGISKMRAHVHLRRVGVQVGERATTARNRAALWAPGPERDVLGEQSETCRRIREHLAARPASTVTEIAEAIGAHPPTVSYHLQRIARPAGLRPGLPRHRARTWVLR